MFAPDKVPNIPAPRCCGKIPRRRGSVAIISVFICRGVSLPPFCLGLLSWNAFGTPIDPKKKFVQSIASPPAPNCGRGWRPLRGGTRGRRRRTRVVIVFLSCSHGITSFYIRVYPATFLCHSEQSFSSTLGRSVNPTIPKYTSTKLW